MGSRYLIAALLVVALGTVAEAQPGAIEGVLLKKAGSSIGECRTLDLLNGVTVTRSGETCSISDKARAVNVRDYIDCAMTQDNRSVIAALVGTGGVAAGKTLFLPSGCKALLSSPGAGSTALDLASNTQIQCEDATAGFALARRRCTGGSLNGVACDADAQCQGGTCSLYDGGTSGSFAPTSGSTYTVIGAAANTSGQAIVGCSIWANQTQGASTAMGGDGIETGYCSGGTNDGDTCFQTCDTGDATWAGMACNASGATDCGSGSGSCQNRSQCATGGGTCVSIPYNVSRGASGAGAINPIDFSNSTSARVENVRIWDHRKGDFAIASGTGTSSRVIDSSTVGITTDTKSATGFGLTSYNANRFVTYGIKAGANSRIRGNTTAGWDAGIYLATEVIASGNTSDGLPGALTNNPLAPYDHTGGLDYSSWKGSVGFLAAGPTTLIEGNRSTAFICAAGKNGGQHNWFFKDNVCEDNHGPKVIANGSGIEIETNRFAWNTRDTIIALGDVRGRCSGGSSRPGLVCLRNMGTAATYGCPSGTCDYSSDFKWGASNVQIDHVNIVGNFLHSDQQNVDYIGVAPGKRCQTGADAGKECTSTGDCDGSAACEFPYVKDLNIVGNNAYGATTGDTAVDFSAVTGVRSSGTTTPILNINIAANRFQGFPTGVAFASASGLGAHINIEGTFQNGTTPLVNWRNEYGYAFDIMGLLTTDEQGVVVRKTAGGTIARGKFVKQDTSNDNRVVVVGFSEGDDVVGVALEDATSGNPVKIMTQGYAQCLSDSGSITKGQLLRVTNSGDPSTPVAGQVYASTLASDVIVGVADENDGAADALFRCVVRQPAVVNSTTSPFTSAYRTSDSSTLTNDNTLNDDTQLSVAVSANKNYLVDGVLMVNAPATSPDFLVALNTPASPTAINVGYVGGDTPAIGVYQSADNTAAGTLQLPNGTTSIVFGGVLENGSNAGNLVVAWSQSTNNGSGVTVKRGSYIRIQELP